MINKVAGMTTKGTAAIPAKRRSHLGRGLNNSHIRKKLLKLFHQSRYRPYPVLANVDGCPQSKINRPVARIVVGITRKSES
jgi:hypothetical protein